MPAASDRRRAAEAPPELLCEPDEALLGDELLELDEEELLDELLEDELEELLDEELLEEELDELLGELGDGMEGVGIDGVVGVEALGQPVSTTHRPTAPAAAMACRRGRCLPVCNVIGHYHAS